MDGETPDPPEGDRLLRSVTDAEPASADLRSLLAELTSSVLQVLWPDKESIFELLFHAGLESSNYAISGRSGGQLWTSLFPLLESRQELPVVLRAVQPKVGESRRKDVAFIIELAEKQCRRAAADRERTRVIAELESMWAVLRQAFDHQMTLLMPSHPSPARIAGLRSWIHGCVKSVSRCQRSVMQTEEAAQVEEIATYLAAVTDAFQMYAHMLERFRSTNDVEPPQSPQPRPLAAVAEDERLLLNCRTALRTSMQQLISVLQPDN